MAKGPKISSRVRRLITRVAQDHPRLYAKEVLENVRPQLDKWRERQPGLSAAQKIMTSARKVKDPRDQPWNLALGFRFGVPAEATADLLAIWKGSIIGGTVFTVRQAIWAARLRGAISETSEAGHIWQLYYWASNYAADERGAEALEEEFDTTHLDWNLAFKTPDGGIDWAMAYWAAKLGIAVMPDHLFVLRAPVEKGEVDDALTLAADTVMDSEEVWGIREMIRSSPTLPEPWPAGREDYLVLIVRNIINTRRWQDMKEADRIGMVHRLVSSQSDLEEILVEVGLEEGDPIHVEIEEEAHGEA